VLWWAKQKLVKIVGFHHCVVDIGCEIGDNCIVGTSSLVRTNFPKNSVVTGSPAKLLRKNV